MKGKENFINPIHTFFSNDLTKYIMRSKHLKFCYKFHRCGLFIQTTNWHSYILFVKYLFLDILSNIKYHKLLVSSREIKSGLIKPLGETEEWSSSLKSIIMYQHHTFNVTFIKICEHYPKYYLTTKLYVDFLLFIK